MENWISSNIETVHQTFIKQFDDLFDEQFDTFAPGLKLGGLRYPCIDRFFEAIRLTWTRDLFSTEANGSWKVMAEKILSMYDDRPFLVFGQKIFSNCRSSSATSQAPASPTSTKSG